MTERPGRYTRIVLMLSFGALLSLLLAAGWQAISMLDQAHTQESLARTDFLARNECLMRLDTKLVVFGQAGRPVQVTELREEMRGYPGARSPQEQVLLDHLAAALASQDQVVNLPAPLHVMAATQQVAIWNHDRFRGANAQLLANFDRLRANLKSLLSILLGSGLLLSIGSIVYIAGQEREARKRYAELAESRDAQERLSARLLDAQEQERRSISRELHDEVGQSLGALLVDVGRLSAQLPPGDAKLQEHVSQIRTVAERSVEAVRNIALLLRPSMLDDLGLTAALEWQAREVSRRSEMEVEVKADRIPDDLTEDQKICVYRLVQEALNNAARHSGAHHAWVTVRREAEKLLVEIRDNGHGFDPERSRGLGLLGMEERIRHLRGTLHIASKPGDGTAVTAELPLV